MGSIHPAADEIYFSRFPSDREKVAPFLACFTITRGERVIEGETEVGAFYLKPDSNMKEFLGVDRQLLLVYAPFSDLQHRSIEQLEKLLAADPVKLDPIVSILMSDDPGTEQMVHQYLARRPERPPVIGVTSGKLPSIGGTDAIRNLFIRQAFSRDLFGGVIGGLKTDATFFGRRELVSELIASLLAGENAGLFGLRRMGKTSVLYALERRCEATGEARTVYLDAQGRWNSRWWDLLGEIARRFAETKEAWQPYERGDADRRFTSEIRQLLNRPPQKLILLIDEVENLTLEISPGEDWSSYEGDFLPFWQTLRRTNQETRGKFSFVIAGVNPRASEIDKIGPHDNPLFGTLPVTYLPPFTQQQVEDMITAIGRYMGLRFEPELSRALSDEYGGHPFLIRQACSALGKLVTELPTLLTSTLFYARKKRINRSVRRFVRQILDVLATWYPEEYELLQALAEGDVHLFSRGVHELEEIGEHMQGYGLVEDPFGAPSLTMEVAREYLQRQARRRTGAWLADADEKDGAHVRAAIQQRRDPIERRVRGLLKDRLRSEFGRGAASELLKILGQREILTYYGYEEVWSKLFWKDLRTVVEKRWKLFQNYFSKDKSDVLHWFDVINKCRRDAHATEISDEELAHLNFCFFEFEVALGLRARP